MSFTFDPEADDGFRRRRKRLPRWIGPGVLGLIALSVVTLFILRGPQIGVRENEQKTINVVLPPPPPPPPPPPEPKPPEPKPTITPPTPTPQTPPPPTQAPPQAAAPDAQALTAREGPAAGSFGLNAGDGSGKIGGKAGGGNGWDAYSSLAEAEIRRATAGEPALHTNSFKLVIVVEMAPDGRIASVHVQGGSKNPKLNEAVNRLVGLQLSRRPPDGLPVMRLQLDTGSGA